jgi:hypothetical protein
MVIYNFSFGGKYNEENFGVYFSVGYDYFYIHIMWKKSQ